jgi:NitT/TauT family transport system permease protein
MSVRALQRIPPRYRRPETLTALIVVGALAFAELIVIADLVDPLLLRRPSVVFLELVALIAQPDLQADVLMTSQRVAITFLICVALGSVISVLLWQYELLRRAYLPLLGAIFGTPIVLLYLVFVVLFGRGTAAIVAISIPIGVIPMVINATDALASVEEVYVDIARSFNADFRQTLTKVIIPDAAPDIFAGIRIGFSYIVTSVTAIEFLLVVDLGLGGHIANTYFRFDTTGMLVGITFVVVIVIVAIFLLRQLEAVIQR